MVEVTLGQPHQKGENSAENSFWWQTSFLIKVARRKNSPGTQKTISKSFLFPVFQRVKRLIALKEGGKQLKYVFLAALRVLSPSSTDPFLFLLSFFCLLFCLCRSHKEHRALSLLSDHKQIVKATTIFPFIKGFLIFFGSGSGLHLIILKEIKGIGQLYLIFWSLSFFFRGNSCL